MKKKREKIRGRAAAVIAMVLLIVVSIPLGMGLSLVRERNNASEHYYGSNDTFGLIEDLHYCSSEAANLATLGGKYLAADDVRLADVRETASALTAAEYPAEKAAAYTKLTQEVNTLYNALCDTEMSAQDAEYREEIYVNYKTYVDLVSYNEYNVRATEFNETLRNAPGRPIAAVMGVRELELFA